MSHSWTCLSQLSTIDICRSVAPDQLLCESNRQSMHTEPELNNCLNSTFDCQRHPLVANFRVPRTLLSHRRETTKVQSEQHGKTKRQVRMPVIDYSIIVNGELRPAAMNISPSLACTMLQLDGRQGRRFLILYRCPTAKWSRSSEVQIVMTASRVLFVSMASCTRMTRNGNTFRGGHSSFAGNQRVLHNRIKKAPTHIDVTREGFLYGFAKTATLRLRQCYHLCKH